MREVMHLADIIIESSPEIPGDTRLVPACGARVSLRDTTLDPDEVTCSVCRGLSSLAR